MTETEEQPRGKGRPTPKRSDARAARKKPVVATRGAKGKEANKARRAAAASARARMREAMRTGDERNYPAIAAGPERALVRDVVDARRSFGWLAIPGWFVAVVLSVTPTVATRAAGSIAFPLVIGIILADSLTTGRVVGTALDRRWPDGTETRRRSLVWYGVARNTQFRRQRLPRPRIERGGQP